MDSSQNKQGIGITQDSRNSRGRDESKERTQGQFRVQDLIPCIPRENVVIKESAMKDTLVADYIAKVAEKKRAAKVVKKNNALDKARETTVDAKDAANNKDKSLAKKNAVKKKSGPNDTFVELPIAEKDAVAAANNKGKSKVKKKGKGKSKVKKNVENKTSSSKEKSSDMPMAEEGAAKADTIQSPKESSGSRSAATGAHKPDHSVYNSKGEDMEEVDTIQSPKRSSKSRSAATGAHKPDHSEGEDMEDSSKSSEDMEDSSKSSKRNIGVMGRSDMPIKKTKYLPSREKFVYLPQENVCPTQEDDIALTWVQSSSKNTVISDVLDLLLIRYKKKKTVQEALKGLSAKDLLYQELKWNGCHIMFSAPKPGLGARKVIAAAITERVIRYPADEFSPHRGLSIRFHCANIQPLQCLFHRILSTVYWDNRLFKHDKHRTTHIYLRLVKDTSPSLFKVRHGSVEDEKALWNKFGFLDAVDKSAPEEYFWKEDRDIEGWLRPVHQMVESDEHEQN